MNRNKVIIVILAALLFGAAVAAVYIAINILSSENKQVLSNETELQNQLNSVTAQNTELENQLNATRSNLAECIARQEAIAFAEQSRLDSVANAKAKADSLAAAKKKRNEIAYLQSRVKSLEDKIKQEPVQLQPPPPPTTTSEIVTPPSSGTELSPIYYEGNSKEILFCVNYDQNPGWHLPHLAMLEGANFGSKVASNNQSGFNFVIRVENMSSGLIGDFGVTVDGTFFVKKSFVDKYNPGATKIFIKATATGWREKEMKLREGYYVWK